MIEHDLLKDQGILIVKPDGPLSQEDFTSLARTIDPVLDEIGGLNGLLIDAPEFPGWKDFAGLVSHIRFVKNHHERVQRVAVVSDSSFVKRLPAFASHFVKAELRRFTSDQRNDAISWLSGEPVLPVEAPATLRFFQNEDPPAIWIEIAGKITRDDYLKMLEPLKQQIASGSKLSILAQVKECDGMEIGAVWEDLKFGLGHIKDIRRMALVTDAKWMDAMIKIMDPFVTTEMKAFPEEEEMKAWEWVLENEQE